MTGVVATYRRESYPDATAFHAHKTPFTPVFGREQELERLHAAWKNRVTALFTLQGCSGMGKTTLLHLWLQQLASEYWQGVDTLFFWSFPQTDTPAIQRVAIDDFFRNTLSWLQGAEVALLAEHEYPLQLAQCLQQHRVLLVLDNVPCLHIAGKTELDVMLLTFLQQLTANPSSMCLLAGCPVMPDTVLALPNAEHLELEPLTAEAATRLLKHLGVSGEEISIQRVAQQFGEHPAALTWVASYLTHWHAGEISRADSIPIWYDSHTQGRASRRIMAAFEAWLEGCPELAMLYFLPLFHLPFCRADLQAWAGSRSLPWLTRWHSEPGSYENLLGRLQTLPEEGWKKAWQRLLALNLLIPCADGLHFELQAVVREYFMRQSQTHYPGVWERMRPKLILPAANQDMNTRLSSEQLAAVLRRRTQYQDWLEAETISGLIGEKLAIGQNTKAAIDYARQAVVYADLGRNMPHLQTRLLALAGLLEQAGEHQEAASLCEQANYMQA